MTSYEGIQHAQRVEKQKEQARGRGGEREDYDIILP